MDVVCSVAGCVNCWWMDLLGPDFLWSIFLGALEQACMDVVCTAVDGQLLCGWMCGRASHARLCCVARFRASLHGCGVHCCCRGAIVGGWNL